MATVPSEVAGTIVSVVGTDGTNFYLLKTDADGHLQCDLLGNITIQGVATESTLQQVRDRLPSSLVGGRLVVDGSGVTQPISAASLPLPTGAATESTLSALKTLLSAKWLDLFDSQYSEVLTGSADSGNITIEGTAVPTGKLLVVTNMLAYISSGSCQQINLAVNMGGSNRVLKRVLNPSVNYGLDWQGKVVLVANDKVRVNINAVGTGTTAYLQAVGYFVPAS